MADKGDNQDEALAQAQAKIKELEGRIAELTKEMEKKSGIVDNAEKKFNEMAQETGDNRKAIAEAAKELVELRRSEKKAMEDLAKVRDELAEARKQGPQGDQGQSVGKEKEKTADEIEAELTDDEQKQLDDAWKQAPEELKARIKADPRIRKSFLLEAKKAAEEVAASDLTDWRNKPAQKKPAAPGGAADEIRKLFKREKQSAGRRVPDGPTGGGGRESGDRPQPASRQANVLIG